MFEAYDPLGEGSGNNAFGKKKEKQVKGMDELRLVKSWASGAGIKRI